MDGWHFIGFGGQGSEAGFTALHICSALLSLDLFAGCSALPEQVAEDMASDLYQISGYRKMNAIYKSTHGCAALTRISST